MRRKKKRRAWALVLLVLLCSTLVWYVVTYSMTTAPSYQINDTSAAHHILIATQGSVYKDSVVRRLLKELKPLPVYVKLIDVTSLPSVNEDDWVAIVVLHTWKFWRPQKDARNFIQNTHSKNKLIVMSTSGNGWKKLEDIDAITSA